MGCGWTRLAYHRYPPSGSINIHPRCRAPRGEPSATCGVVTTMEPHLEQLTRLAECCLNERPSRRLDGEIYCALHCIPDLNSVDNERLIDARLNGEVLVQGHRGLPVGWIEAPPFTSELAYAEALLPDGVRTILRDPMKVCAAALRARALSDAPPPRVSDLFEFRSA